MESARSEATHSYMIWQHGLLRYARNDDGTIFTAHHLFKKFSGRPGRAQSIATSSPLPESVM
jgi:hypothetical protein